MKLKAVLVGSFPEQAYEHFGSPGFTADFMDRVLGDCFGVKDPRNRPAEYYVQKPDRANSLSGHGILGLEVRLTGVSRNGRPTKIFHDALRALESVSEKALEKVLPVGEKAQIFCVIMLDGDVENPPGSGNYSSVLENSPKFITVRTPDQT